MEETKINKSLKVLITTDTVGGVWTYCMELCKSLQPFNVNFFLVTTGARMKPWQKAEVAEFQNVTVYETDYLLEWMENPWADIEESYKWILNLEEEIQPDLVHLNSYCYGALQWKSPAVVVAHSDVYSWWLSVKNDDPPAEWKEYFWRVKQGLKNADLIIAPSKTMMDYVKNIYSVGTDNTIIYNSRSEKIFYPAAKQKQVMSMGRIWDEAKNIQLIVNASKQIQYPIKIAGDNNFAKNNYNSSAENIEFLGSINATELAKHLSATYIYALPAKYEPFGLSALEAALSGCVLVLGNIDSLKEIWEDNALYVDTDDAIAFAETINSLINNDELLAQFAGKARKHAQKYSTKIMAQKYLQVYQQLLQYKNEKAHTAIV